jgi:hypothetical protein
LSCNYPPQPIHSEATALLNATLDSDTAGEDIFQDDTCLDPLTTEPTIGLLDLDFAAGVDSVNTMNDLLNDDIEEAFPVSIQRYTAAKEFVPHHISPEALRRVEYSIEQMKLAPRTMVMENCTPWVHPSLYEEHLPQSMQGSLGLILILPPASHHAIHHPLHFTPQPPRNRLAFECRTRRLIAHLVRLKPAFLVLDVL